MTKLIFLWTGKAPLPAYAFDSLRLNAINSQSSISLILSSENYSHCVQQILSQIPEYPIETLCLDDFYIRDKRLDALQFCGDLNFRNGFWLHTYERTLVLIEYYMSSGVPFFHSELDNICFCLDALEARLSSLPINNPCFARDNWKRAVLSLAYFQNRNSLSNLRESLLTPGSTMIRNDMHDLGMFMHSFPDLTSSFPLEQSFLSSNESLSWNSLSPDHLQGVFDANTIGQYILGIDIANTSRLWNGFVNENALIPPHLLNYSIHYYTKHRFVIRLSHQAKSYPLFNIHIHSKAIGILKYPILSRILFFLLNLRIFVPVFNLHRARRRVILKLKNILCHHE